jgi:signal transduction histidine kinase
MAPPRPGPGETGPSIRRTFLVGALAVTLPFLALLGYLAWDQWQSARARAVEAAFGQAARLGAEIERHVGTRLESLAGVASAVAGSPGGPGAEAQVRRLRQTFPDLDRVFVVDELGATVVSVPAPGEGRRGGVGDQDWFKRAATATEPFAAGATARGPDIQVGLFAAARTPEGSLHGVVGAELSLRRIQELLGQASLGEPGVVELLTEKGVVLARQPALYLLQDQGGQPGYAELLRQKGGTRDLVLEDGERRLVGAVPVRPMGWLLVAGVPATRVVMDARRQILVLAGMGVVIAVVGVAGSLVIGRRVAAGLERLRSAMTRVEAGDLPAALSLTVGGEVGALTDSFNRMLTRLRRKMRDYEALSQVEEVAAQAAGATGADPSADRTHGSLLRRVVSGMGADVGILVLAEDGVLVTRALVGFPGVPAEGHRQRSYQGLAGVVVSERAPMVVPDVDADHRVDEPYLRESGIRAVAAVPMESGDEVVGVLEVGYRGPHPFAPDEVERLAAMARRAVQAIERARAVESVQRNTQGLEAQVAEQMEALHRAATDRVEADRQAEEARRRTQELERKIQQQAAQAPAVRETIREVVREVVKPDPAAAEQARVRAAMQKTVSVELRAPLGALMDLPRLLVDGLQKPLGDDQRQQLDILQERSQEIVELIENLALLTGLQGGRVPVAKAPVDVQALINRVVRTLQPRAAARGNRIEAEVKPGVGRVTTDGRRLEQALTGLLLTSIRYTEVGEIRVTCYLREPDLVITVADDGVGFTAEEQGRIFEPFLTVAARGGRTLPGTGLSLTACDRLVTALGGKIRVESEVDRGTWFTLTLPAGS